MEAEIQTYFLAFMMPERYRLPFLLLRKVTPPTLDLLGVAFSELYPSDPCKRALILFHNQCDLTMYSSQLTSAIHDLESKPF